MGSSSSCEGLRRDFINLCVKMTDRDDLMAHPMDTMVLPDFIALEFDN